MSKPRKLYNYYYYYYSCYYQHYKDNYFIKIIQTFLHLFSMFYNIFLVFNYLINIALSTIQIYDIVILYANI